MSEPEPVRELDTDLLELYAKIARLRLRVAVEQGLGPDEVSARRERLRDAELALARARAFEARYAQEVH